MPLPSRGTRTFLVAFQSEATILRSALPFDPIKGVAASTRHQSDPHGSRKAGFEAAAPKPRYPSWWLLLRRPSKSNQSRDYFGFDGH